MPTDFNTDNSDNSDNSDKVARKLPLEAEHLEALSRMQSLTPYYQWSIELVAPWLGKRVLDAGCGIGNATEQLRAYAEYVLAVDLSPENMKVLQHRFADDPHVECAQFDLDENMEEIASRNIDSIVCFDVLEHVEDDQGLLDQFFNMVQPGGHLLIKVPAGRWLYGSVDIASAHFRRYIKSELKQKALQSGWQIKKIHYMNIFGVIPYFIKSRILRKQANFSRTMSTRQLARIKRMLPIFKIIDRFIGPPIGQSLILIAQKPCTEGHSDFDFCKPK
ncbi:methyltransferase domain-containing protein [Gimesia sp.]|uniref:class I SAM-dependent methyltransferase n=1 Tax=Gimesia sp. TaxID=2024833 RepID=UPI000C543236|nr:methyltransferase domain-containing protein [Gimesia sp.]MAX36471.1 hypothetical protein [Gimesia sp.]HAH49266.1 hypothetical protein [Planctomycetaceae bacterium]HBL43435.1 hypothetical protein [Planctomycetaceae bacterium]|tara:strand:- start:2028 stop:2855 length:828 start_codon:yes stop_codon:yes gene_type:complete